MELDAALERILSSDREKEYLGGPCERQEDILAVRAQTRPPDASQIHEHHHICVYIQCLEENTKSKRVAGVFGRAFWCVVLINTGSIDDEAQLLCVRQHVRLHTHAVSSEFVLLSCSNTRSWPSRSRCLVSVVTHTRSVLRICAAVMLEHTELAKPVEMPCLCCNTRSVLFTHRAGRAGQDAVPSMDHTHAASCSEDMLRTVLSRWHALR